MNCPTSRMTSGALLILLDNEVSFYDNIQDGRCGWVKYE
jgi:hypothetical protein